MLLLHRNKAAALRFGIRHSPYQGDISTPVVDPAINDTTPNSSTTLKLKQSINLNIIIQ
jgi:hypothetical protein